MHLEFSYTFDDYKEANQAYMRRSAGGGPARLTVLVLFMCVIVIGGSAFFEAARSTTPAAPGSSTPATPMAQGGGSFAANFVLPFIPWLLILALTWTFVFRRLTPRKPTSFLYDSNADADAERGHHRPWWPRLFVVALAVLALLAMAVLLLRDVGGDAGPTGGDTRLIDTLLPLSPWLVIFLIIWVFVFRLLRRQTRQNWEGQPNMHLDYRMDVSPDGVSVANPVFSSAYRWEAFQRVHETPNLFILFLSTLTFVLIPKRAVADAQAVDWLRGTLRTMIAERPTPAFPVVMHAPPQ